MRRPLGLVVRASSLVELVTAVVTGSIACFWPTFCGRLSVASETESVDRKQRQLERLRKEAIKRGYIAASGGAKPADNQKKQVEQLLVRPVVVEAGETDSARVPPIPEVETKEKHSQVQPSDTEVKGSTSKDLKKDEFHARISERFAGFEARKQRMRLLRSRLNQLEEQKMDDAYGQAIDRLQNLTSMRKQLESMQAGEGTTSSSEAVKALAEEVEQLAETSSSSPSSREKSNVNELDSSKTPASQELDSGEEGQSATTDELIQQVRQSFNAIFPVTVSAPPSTSNSQINASGRRAPLQNTESALENRLRSIESLLHNHTDLLNWIGGQVSSLSDSWEQRQANHSQNAFNYNQQPRPSTSSVATIVTLPVASPTSLSPNNLNLALPQVQDLASVFKSCLLSADPAVIYDLVRVLTANTGVKKRSTEIEEVLHRLVAPPQNVLKKESLSPSPPVTEPTKEQYEETSVASHVLEWSGHTEPLITVGDSATPIEQSFDSADGQKIDPVSQRLDTENGRLKKQRTLENVRIYANTNNPMEMGDRVEESLVCGNAEAKTEEPLGSSENGIEKEIFSVVEFIVTWIDEHKNDLVVQDALDGFRDAIILKTKEIFSPNEHPHSEDFDKQLGTVIDDCLAKYVGVNLALHKEGVILDLAENLYNEFAFIKLMNSVDSIGRK